MRRLLFLFIATTVAATAALAQGSIGKNDPEAKKVLDAVSTKFKSYKTVQATFTLQNKDAAGKTLGTKKGTVSMKGPRYRVTITGQEIFCDGSTIWTYDKSSNEVTVTKVDPSATTITPQKLFTNFYDKDFLYKLNGDKKVGTRTVQEIEMTPVDKTKQFHKVYILVDKAAQSIYSSKVLDKSGNVYEYTVNTMNTKAPLTDAYFIFDKSKYPGVEVVDLQ
ncbi:MAG: outer membrane lipoprotein carrier protein LolA [Chitinophagaceae bacterium]